MSWRRIIPVALALTFAFLVELVVPIAAAYAQGVERGGGQKPARDVFRVLIIRKRPPRRRSRYVPKVKPRPVIPRLKLKVQAIAGEAPDFVAVVKYKGKEYIVEKDWEPMDKQFKVVNINADKVEVYYKPTKSRKVFHF